MKLLKCEICGSTDIMKQNGVFVCNECGCKYSAEEARRMLTDNSIDADESPKNNDAPDELANLYQIARRAKNDNHGEMASKYYELILIKDPNSWEASFYPVYFKAAECKIAQIRSAAISVGNCIDTTLKLIRDYVENKDEQIQAVAEVALRCTTISSMLYQGAKNHYDGISAQIQGKFTQEMVNNCCAAREIMYLLGDNIDGIFGDYSELQDFAVSAWKDGVNKHNGLMTYFANKEENKKTILSYASKIQKYESSYRSPEIDTSTGCYIATSVYGSYDCPQVWTLRRYRDFTLSQTWCGRAFIRVYYSISPTLVRWFGQTMWFKRIWKGRLDQIVATLNENGVENTPYVDRRW